MQIRSRVLCLCTILLLLEAGCRTPAVPLESTPSGTPPAILTSGQGTAPVPTELPEEIDLDPADWKDWPVLPVVTQGMINVYQLGQRLGNDPRAFSVFGDCQSLPDVFLGVYANDIPLLFSLAPELQETVFFFYDSMARQNPALLPGTTTASLLTPAWTHHWVLCSPEETPVECELRLNRPSFVLITIGTHWTERNREYVARILDGLLADGIVPILFTKADSSDQDEHINYEYASLAAEYGLPLVNFWAVVADLPERGLYVRPEQEHLGKVYLTDEASQRFREVALQGLDRVWRSLTGR